VVVVGLDVVVVTVVDVVPRVVMTGGLGVVFVVLGMVAGLGTCVVVV
jgi:hypothetical protein